MYLPSAFEETRPEVLHALMREHPLGALVTQGPAGLDANHLPFELDTSRGTHGTLTGHVARANPLWREVADGDEVLVIFKGGDAYVSPNWYPSKHESHQQVPTWNYCVVHAHGHIKIRDDEKFVRGVVARLTRTHEKQAEPDSPWKMTDSSPDYIARMLGAIVGIEIDITRLLGKFKLSQNREQRDADGVVQALRDRHQDELVRLMTAGPR
ncbi:FMN-binding negative transcriptional regulator [Pollutimonas thiosulfatoxidans]|uniref:Transcriptional regulator n=1 Tax=Pollutimonas thiosulfatoxidans TaxID=2028345 RepID=A0A410GBR0_9BURK|nr:FMN-binding negative transcriptional regulator [Pollutimonas thiosulfatoxidans]MBF6615822.1 FMN-binding negative transcriptional regulator [Candidimonas sp.]QAA93732.1 transcriptional regulator [Pollutimonas thiosulfatoxidans]